MSDEPMIVDAARQHDFNSLLVRKTQKIEELIQTFNSQLGKLGRDWQDVQFDQFRTQARNTLKALEKFKAESQKLTSGLRRSAARAEEYERIREG